MANRQSDKYTKQLDELKDKVKKIEYLKYTLNSLIYWDKITYMPVNAIGYRSEVMGFLGEEMYKRLSDIELKKHLDYFEGNEKNDHITDGMIARLKRSNAYVNKIPEKEYGQYISLIAGSEQVWEEAKTNNDFKKFAPYLEKIISTFKGFAEYWSYEENPYDALIGYYEEGVTTKQIDALSNELRDFLIELIGKIRAKEAAQNFTGVVANVTELPLDKQKEVSKWILDTVGFDFNSGRLDEGAHPTTLASSPSDVRIVTTYNEHDIRTGIFNTLHEGGKGLYEQDIDKNLMGTLLAEVASFGVEEAIGRFYENIIGRSRGFTKLLAHKLQELSELDNMAIESPDELYKAVNRTESSLIRLDADELTYTLHIIIRYELEKELINGELAVDDLPAAWNKKYRDYLGVEPPTDSGGVLQDIQWAAGYVGFFPSYFLANIMAAQFKVKMEKELGSLEELIEAGRFGDIHEWLAENVHKYGAVYSTSEIIKRATGEELASSHYIDYLKKKYSEVL